VGRHRPLRRLREAPGGFMIGSSPRPHERRVHDVLGREPHLGLVQPDHQVPRERPVRLRLCTSLAHDRLGLCRFLQRGHAQSSEHASCRSWKAGRPGDQAGSRSRAGRQPARVTRSWSHERIRTAFNVDATRGVVLRRTVTGERP
jgi:hypothetical protein